MPARQQSLAKANQIEAAFRFSTNCIALFATLLKVGFDLGAALQVIPEHRINVAQPQRWKTFRNLLRRGALLKYGYHGIERDARSAYAGNAVLIKLQR